MTPGRTAQSDEELMLGYKRGDTAALQSLFIRHSRRLHAFFYCLLGDKQQAEDCSEKTWLRLHEQRAAYAGERLLPFLYSLAVQVRRDSARAEVVHKSQPGAARSVSDAESLVRALRDLPDSYREVVVLRHLIDLSIPETALVLGATQAAVAQRAQQGDEQLARIAALSDSADGRPGAPVKELFAPALLQKVVEPALIEQSARAILPTVARDLRPRASALPLALFLFIVLASVLLSLWSLRPTS
jgi:RNA polymerase sigma-70 factor (ECF subfamily)